MWPFSNPNQHIIDAKLKQRAKALALAPSFNEAAYESFLNATGEALDLYDVEWGNREGASFNAAVVNPSPSRPAHARVSSVDR